MWEQVQRVFVVICLTSIVVSPVGACNTLVFRYALQQWEPDAFDVVVLHREPLANRNSNTGRRPELARASANMGRISATVTHQGQIFPAALPIS